MAAIVVAPLNKRLSEPKVMNGSVAPEPLNVHVKSLPLPNVVVPISVVSRLRVTVRPLLSTVSIPLVPPRMLRV